MFSQGESNIKDNFSPSQVSLATFSRMKFLVLVSLVVFSQALRYDGDQVLSLYPQAPSHLQLLRELEEENDVVDFWSPASAAGVKIGSKVDVRFSQRALRRIKSKLDSAKMAYDVKINNLQDLMQDRLNMDRKMNVDYFNYDYNVYHTYEEIQNWITDTAVNYPSLARKSLFAISTEGREVNMLTIGSSTDNPIILIDCGIGAREWISPAFCQCFINELLSKYGQDEHVTHMMDHITWMIIPLLNVDGYEYSWTNDRLWRKTRSYYKGNNCIGVDANRNFDINWSGEGASNSSCSNTYCGPYKESEPIVKALSDLIRREQGHIEAYIAFHSYGQIFVYPYSYDYKIPENNDQLLDTSARAAQAIYETSGKTFTYGPGHQSLNLASGESKDMALDHSIPLSWTIELRDTGDYGFLLPEDQIAEVCAEMFEAMVVIEEEAHHDHDHDHEHEHEH